MQASAADGPLAWWKFDGPAAVDAASGVADALEGNSKFMAEGVRGGCLRIDGFTTLMRRKADKVPDLEKGFTFQGWGEHEAALKLDGAEVPRGKDFRYGFRRTLVGTDLIVWIKCEAVKQVRLVLSAIK